MTGATDKVYVWVYWNYGGRRPTVERYELVKLNPAGGVTVKKYGGTMVIRPATGKKFFTSYEELLRQYRKFLEGDLQWTKDHLENLQEDLAKPDLGMNVSVTPGEERPPRGKLKLDEEPG